MLPTSQVQSALAIFDLPVRSEVPRKDKISYLPRPRTEKQQLLQELRVTSMEYNYLTKDELVQKGVPIDYGKSMEVPGVSAFLRDGETIFHTYTTYARGTDLLLGMFNYLDLTALGRQEDWEQPTGRSDGNGKTWLRRHDEYEHSFKSDSCCS